MNREYGRRLYVDGKYDMSKVTEKLMNDEFIFRNSEFKKPYLFRDYAKMEYGWNPTHWDGGGGFDMPSNFDSLRRKGQGYPGLQSRLGGLLEAVCGGHIKYTTTNMLDNETQTLSIGSKPNPSKDVVYNRDELFVWGIEGQGGLSNTAGGRGGSTLFTPTQTGENHNVTITLGIIAPAWLDMKKVPPSKKAFLYGSNILVCDSLTITVRCSNGSWVLQSTDSETETCPPASESNWYKICTFTVTDGEWKYVYETYWQWMCSVMPNCGTACTELSGYCSISSSGYVGPDYIWKVWKQTKKNYKWICP